MPPESVLQTQGVCEPQLENCWMNPSMKIASWISVLYSLYRSTWGLFRLQHRKIRCWTDSLVGKLLTESLWEVFSHSWWFSSKRNLLNCSWGLWGEEWLLWLLAFWEPGRERDVVPFIQFMDFYWVFLFCLSASCLHLALPDFASLVCLHYRVNL